MHDEPWLKGGCILIQRKQCTRVGKKKIKRILLYLKETHHYEDDHIPFILSQQCHLSGCHFAPFICGFHTALQNNLHLTDIKQNSWVTSSTSLNSKNLTTLNRIEKVAIKLMMRIRFVFTFSSLLPKSKLPKCSEAITNVHKTLP